MSSIDPLLRDAAVARVQALTALDRDFPSAVRFVADDMDLNKSSVRRWAYQKIGDDTGGAGDRPTQFLGADAIRTAALHLLRQYETAGGKSVDDYFETPQVHPMAEGKYLSALAALQRTGTVKDITGRMRQSVIRLEQTAVPQSKGLAWGLGFPFREASAAEPYVITTCIVITGLMDAIQVADGEDRDRLVGLAGDALTWLREGAARESWEGIDVPTFSQSIPEVVFNVVAQWSHVLIRAQNLDVLPSSGERQPDDYYRAATTVLAEFQSNVGWTYGKLSTRSDLLHTCYIGNALLQALPDRREQIDRTMLVATTQFLSPHGWFDRFDVLAAEEAMARPWPWNGRTHRFLDDTVLLGFDRPARPWSVGELLVLAAASSADGSTSHFWTTQLRPMATLAVGKAFGAKAFRHSMHLAHGLTTVLESLRRDRKPQSV